MLVRIAFAAVTAVLSASSWNSSGKGITAWVLKAVFPCLLAIIPTADALAESKSFSAQLSCAKIHGFYWYRAIDDTPPPAVISILREEGNNAETTASLVAARFSPFSANRGKQLCLAQQVDGLWIFGAYVIAGIGEDTEVDALRSDIVTLPIGKILPSSIGVAGALESALKALPNAPLGELIPASGEGSGPYGKTTQFSGASEIYEKAAVTPVAIRQNGNDLQEGFWVEYWAHSHEDAKGLLVDGLGQVLEVADLIPGETSIPRRKLEDIFEDIQIPPLMFEMNRPNKPAWEEPFRPWRMDPIPAEPAG